VTEVVMPRLSDSMEEGTILRWLKAAGDAVARGDALAEIETDKATMTYEADAEGVLEILVAEGETLPVGAVIGRIGGGAGKAAGPAERGSDAPAAPPPAPAPPAGAVVAAPVVTAAGNGARVKVSPVARRIAHERGVDVAALHGTGPGGRVVRADVEGAAAAADAAPERRLTAQVGPAPAAEPAPAPGPGGGAKGEILVQELTRAQQVVARRMAESRATVPSFTLQAEIDMEACVALRAELGTVTREGPVPSFNDMIIRACAVALREQPRANGAYRDGHFELPARVNVGLAVAGDDTLVVPVVADADLKSLSTIAAETRALARRVREGTITPPELSGGTFTVSNLGMFGVSSFEAVINPPQAAIIAVGEVARRPAVIDGQVVARQRMTVTLACDHRILYGADAARFVGRVRELLERPLALLS
jgi:pyruvate dehydrogenase E2 component (dihydrolipoamide acetyltransferase)